MLRCELRDSMSGRPCSMQYRRQWSLDRHVRKKHQSPATLLTTFVDCTPGVTRRITKHISAVPIPRSQPFQTDTEVPSTTSPSPQPSQGQAASPTVTLDRSPQLSACDSDSDPMDSGSSILSVDEMSATGSESEASGGERKRKRSVAGYDRILHARLNSPMPSYSVRLSANAPEQIKAMDWLGTAAKGVFEAELTHRLAQWGVNRSHQGTCVLIPEEWKGLDPMDLLPLFKVENCPNAQSSRLRYQHSDHNTTFARSKAWFDKWPRSGLELDNFVGSGPFQPMDASHTCHQHLCIAHIVYESADINQDRKRCFSLARELKRQKQAIPEFCKEHDPPCRLQHASLTTKEAFCLQINALRMARGMDQVRFDRPRRHLYSSFETTLPSNLSAVVVDPAHLCTEPPPSLKPAGKPNLLCLFCSKIKNFDSLVGYWGHLVHKHEATDTEARLQEIRRTAVVWRTYWEDYSDGGKRGTKTREKISQAEEDTFDWSMVLDWKLR